MKFTTFAFSLSTAAYVSAEGISIGDGTTELIPQGFYRGANGIQRVGNADQAQATPGAAELGPLEDLDLLADLVESPKDKSLTISNSQATLAADESSLTSAQAAPMEKKKEQVALIAKGQGSAAAKISGSLELKTMDDGSSYLYIKENGAARTFNLNNGVASVKVDGSVSVVGHMEAHGGVALLAAGSIDAKAMIKQKLEFNAQGKVTNLHFYASAQMTVGISIDGTIPEGCEPIEIFKQAKASASVSGGVVAQGWTNGTMSTVTNYTTYCPVETTVTITTCESQICAPQEIVVSSATTITITGECLVEASAGANVANDGPNNDGPKADEKASLRSPAAANISSFNGAAMKGVAGAAGVVGMLALMI